jgi:nicotinamidase-related amidase
MIRFFGGSYYKKPAGGILMGKTAFVIIDVQEAMFSYNNQFPYRGRLVLDNILSLLEKARACGIPVVYIQHTTKDEFAKGTPTWQICSEIAPKDGEPVIEKPTWDAFYRTNLHEVLQSLGVTKLVIAGMQTEFCVDTTCRRAFSMGYQSVLVQDAHTTFDSRTLTAGEIIEHHNEVLGGRFVELKTT